MSNMRDKYGTAIFIVYWKFIMSFELTKSKLYSSYLALKFVLGCSQSQTKYKKYH